MLEKQDEVTVGQAPACVAVRSREAFVTNSASGTVSVIERSGRGFAETATIPVGTEPRPCALTPDGDLLYVGNYTEGTVSVIDTRSKQVIDTVEVGDNPAAIAVTDDTVFVTRFFARLIAGGPGEGFDDGKEGVVVAFPISDPSQATEITLAPIADSGFTADRANLCQQFNAAAPNNTFCPNTNITDPTDPIIAADPQGVFPNNLRAAMVCDGKVYLPNTGSMPEPPVRFNVNIQALVNVVDAQALTELVNERVNLNDQIKNEVQPDPSAGSLVRVFGNDLAAIDADDDCEQFFIVSRGGNTVFKATLGDDGKLDIGAPNVVRFQTGNIPTGIVLDRRGRKAYVNNEVNMSVSILDLQANTVINRDVSSSTPPEPGSNEHARQMGKLVFHTALGVPDNGLTAIPLRDINPVNFRNKASDNGWSSCASCHDGGLADGVTWIFITGPRQTIPLDGTYSDIDGAHDVRIHNWSAVRDSTTDFNDNSRNVQGGCGFASDDFSNPGDCQVLGPATARNPNIFNHGISNGGSEALDMETLWVQSGIRTLNAPQASDADLAVGTVVFGENCASCHGGAKWTKSQVIYLNNPAIVSGTPRDPGLTFENPQIVAYADEAVEPGSELNPLRFLEDIGTFDPNDPIEIRQNGVGALGVLGFNVPSLLGVGSSAPYFHHGAAQTLEEVFDQHSLDGGTIASTLNAGDQAALLAFLQSLDASTELFRSETDDFKEPLP